MRVTMRTTCAGPGGTFHAGKIVNVSEEEARHFIASGYAVAAEEQATSKGAAERATATPGEENAALKQRLSNQNESATAKGGKAKGGKSDKEGEGK